MPDALADARALLARANRIIANEGVVDAFGHVAMRHPANPRRYLLSCSRAPELVQPDDILEFTLDSEPVTPTSSQLYGERFIHGEIFKARPDVTAVCHHHSPQVLPFCISGAELKPVFHLGGTMSGPAPFWDQRDDFGNTKMLVASPEEGASLARALGPHWMVLMRRHGATVAGISVQELVFRTIYTTRNAGLQLQAHLLGHVSPLNDEEADLAGRANLNPRPLARAWEYWSRRLDKVEGIVMSPKPARAAKTSAAKKSSKKKVAKKRSRRQR